jgi:large repetitive protein
LTGTLASGSSTNDLDLTVKVSVSGTGALAGDTVQLYNGADTGNPLGSTYTLTGTDIGNGFATVQTGTLTDGTTYTLTARITDAAGNQSAVSTNSFTVTEDTTAPAPSPGVVGLTLGNDTFVAPVSGSTVYATAATLNAGDSLTGGAGTDVLALLGNGTFNNRPACELYRV